MPESVLLETNLPGCELTARGKVRDIYDAGDNLVFVATDRISAFDVVLPTGIPRKGEALTQLSLFWFDFLKDDVPNHLVSADISDYPQPFHKYADQLKGRSMMVRKLKMLPIECVAREYLAGSGWKEYKATGTVCGVKCPPGLRESGKLPEPIFTPATKSTEGHDINISFEQAAEIVGAGMARRLADLTTRLFSKAGQYALSCGLVLADTKFEFGLEGDEIVLGDEVLTSDSSRYWPLDSYRAGISQPSFDKQFVRDYLETLDWNKQPPGPELPEVVVEETTEKYLEAYFTLTGEDL